MTRVPCHLSTRFLLRITYEATLNNSSFYFLIDTAQKPKDTYGMLAELWRKWDTAKEQLDNHEHSNNNKPTRVCISPPCEKIQVIVNKKF